MCLLLATAPWVEDGGGIIFVTPWENILKFIKVLIGILGVFSGFFIGRYIC